MEVRRLGKTEHHSTVITLGTYAFGNVPQDEADRAIEFALERGINHFDVAPTYAEAEVRLSDYLHRHPQPRLFISCKTQVRDKEGAREQLLRTMERLGRDQLDLYQLHAVCEPEDLEACFAGGGSMEAIVSARDEGLVKHIGITGHGWHGPAVHEEALKRFPFATVMTACNAFMDARQEFHNAWLSLMHRCQAADVGVHVLKATAKTSWGDREPTHNTWYEPLTNQDDIDRAVAWALHQPVTTLCSSGDLTVLPKILDAAERYRFIPKENLVGLDQNIAGYGDIFPLARAGD